MNITDHCNVASFYSVGQEELVYLGLGCVMEKQTVKIVLMK